MRRSCSIISILLTSVPAILTGPAHASLQAGMPIRQVTVYPDRAAVTRDSTFNLEAGQHTVLIDNLPANTLTESIRSSARGVAGITLQGLKFYVQRHLEATQENTALLQRQLANLQEHDRKIQTDRLNVFEDQKKLLASLTSGAGTQMATDLRTGNLKVSDWDATLRFVGDRTKELNDSMRLTQDSINLLDAQIALLESDLEGSTTPRPNEVFVVEVGLSLDRPGRVELSLSYVVLEATWKPMYEARLEDTGEVELVYNAEIMQKTGEDWNHVAVTLSTAMPSLGVGPAETSPYYLSLAEPRYGQVQTVDKLLKQVAGVQVDSTGKVFIKGGRAGEVSYIVDGVSMNDPLGGLNGVGSQLALVPGAIIGTGSYVTTFKVPRPETIPSGENESRVRVGAYHLQATANLISRPKASPGAFRLLTLTNQLEAPLAAGTYAIFDGPNYLGSTALAEFIAPGQEFQLPFGMDNLIRVERKVIGYRKSLSGERVRIDQTVSIEVKNSGRTVATLDLEEPLPIGQDNRIKVIHGDIVPSSYTTDAEGRVTWRLTLAPGQTATVTIPYRIEFPSAFALAGF